MTSQIDALEQAGIDECVEFWRQALRIDSKWEITARIGNKYEMQGNRGMNHIHPENMQSDILIAETEGEETLLHEILHIVVDGFKAADIPYCVATERVINDLAFCLLTFKDALTEEVEKPEKWEVSQRTKSRR